MMGADFNLAELYCMDCSHKILLAIRGHNVMHALQLQGKSRIPDCQDCGGNCYYFTGFIPKFHSRLESFSMT